MSRRRCIYTVMQSLTKFFNLSKIAQPDYVDKFWLIMAVDTHYQNRGSAPEYSLN